MCADRLVGCILIALWASFLKVVKTLSFGCVVAFFFFGGDQPAEIGAACLEGGLLSSLAAGILAVQVATLRVPSVSMFQLQQILLVRTVTRGSDS